MNKFTCIGLSLLFDFKRLQFALLMVAFVFGASSAIDAAELRWKTKEFSYRTTVPKPLKEFIQTFTASQGITAVVSPDVEGNVIGNFSMLPESMLDLLATNYSLIWYFDGNILYVYSANEAKSDIVRPVNSTVNALKQTLTKLDILDKRYPITFDHKQNAALVSGPRRYVELVQQAAKGLDLTQSGASLNSDIRVFVLKYAWANDYRFSQGGKDQMVPGIVSVLRSLYVKRGDARTRLSGASTKPYQSDRDGQGPKKLRSLSSLAGMGGTQSIEQEDTDDGAGAISSSELPQFTADGRLNAVIIRDIPERMASYESVIAALDRRPGIVEIEARIIEVSSDDMESLGIDWRAARWQAPIKGKGVITANYGQTAELPGPFAAGAATILASAGRQLLARVNALAERGKANVLSSPKIQTLDNVEAVIENQSSFFVRVAGNLDTSLYKVSSGISLRVLPLIVDMGDAKKEIRLAVRIEDGSLSSQVVDQVPVTQSTTITTNSLIQEGDALLIAGYASESQREGRSGVPGVSELPGIGRLFSTTEKKVSRVERIFLLTPRIVGAGDKKE